MEVEGFGVSNLELERFFKSNGENLSNNFVGVFPADEKREFINEIQYNDKVNYPFMIANTDLHNKPGVHWWSILDTDERDTLFFFDTLGTYGFNNDLNIFQKLIPGQIKQIYKQDNKITLLTRNFKLENYEKLTQKELNSLSSTAQHFFKFLYEFGTYKKIKNTVKVVTVDDNLQSFNTDYCGVFQLYSYLNLFKPLNTSIVAKTSTKKLDIKLIGELLN